MEFLAPLAAMLVFAYAFGNVFYHVVGRSKNHWLETMAYPMTGIILGEGVWVTYMASGPAIIGIHPVVALASTMIAVLLEGVVESREVRFWRYLSNLRISINGKDTRTTVPSPVDTPR